MPPINFPNDADIRNVKNYGAKGDGVTDDTAALRAAFADNDRVDGSGTQPIGKMAPRTVYFPPGVYLVSDSLIIEGSTLRIAGAGEAYSTIRLKNNSSGFGNASTPKTILRTGTAMTGGNAGFANYVDHITIEVGSGNPGAVGLNFWAANVAAVDHVTIKTADRGARGFVMESSSGTAQVKDLTVIGFDIGVWSSTVPIRNDFVFTGVTKLVGQRIVGVSNGARVMSFERLDVSGSKALEHRTITALTTVLAGSWSGSGSAAVIPEGSYVFLRDITATGYSNLVTVGTSAEFVGVSSLTEWSSFPWLSGANEMAWTGEYASLHLPIKPQPEYHDFDLTHYANALSFKATKNANTNDDTPGIQAAIDSGATTVYLPYGEYTLRTPLYLRGNLRKLDFMGSAVATLENGRIESANSEGTTVIVGNGAYGGELRHNAAGTVAWQNIGTHLRDPQYTTGTDATGDLFISNTGPRGGFTITQPVNVWVRQINRESNNGSRATIENGAVVWLLGSNIEDAADDPRSQPVKVTNSTLEMYGGTFDALGTTDEWPPTGEAAHQIVDSRASILMPGCLTFHGQVGHWLSDTKNGVVVADITDPTVITLVSGGERVVINLYVSPAEITTKSDFPWEMPARTTGKDVLGYFHTLPPYWRNNSTNYEDSIKISSSPTTGGRWRQRPYPLVDNTDLTDEKRIQYARDDIDLAAKIGIDGFTMNIIYSAAFTDTWRWNEHILPYYQAAAQFSAENDPGFTISPNLSMLSISNQGTTGQNPNTWADRIKELLVLPAAYKRDGRPVVMLYNVDNMPASWYQSFHARLLNTHGINVAMIPSHQASSPTGMDNYLTLFNQKKFVALHAWNAPSPATAPSSVYSNFRTWCKNNGVTFVGSAGPAWENDRPTELKEREGRGFQGYQNSWLSSIQYNDPLMAVVSWNDHEESHNVRPSTGYQYAPYDLTAYYVAWYKTGVQPVIKRDALFYAHRMHLGSAAYDTSKQTAGPFNINYGPVDDKVFVTVFLKEPSTVTVTTGGIARSQTAPAGVTNLEFPLAVNDIPKFKITRNGIDVVPEFNSAFRTRGSVVYQDLLYRMGSSTRPAIDAVQNDLPQDRP